jgi:hypothetical protein
MNNNIYPTTANEPKVHPLVKNSFAFVPSAGMRIAPEVLVMELFREVFFEDHHGGTTATKYIDPDELNEESAYFYSENERAVLYSLRGRRKKAKNSRTERFFSPAYPVLARHGWLGKNRERVINNFLLAGPIAQYLWHGGAEVETKKQEHDRIVKVICQALVGHNSCLDDNFKSKEILSVALKHIGHNIDLDSAIENLKEKTGVTNTVIRIDDDELAKRIFRDVQFICELESSLPRMQWIYVLMTFLRFALPMWLLAQMQVTNLLHEWLLDAVDKGHIVDSTHIVHKIAVRNLGLLHPTLTPTREVFEHIERYMKHRIEINILLHCLELVRPAEIKNKRLSTLRGGADTLTVEQLLSIARDSSSDFRTRDWFMQVDKNLDVRRFLTRKGELSAAWRNPLLKGQGKNIDEFLRVMYRAELGDEAGGYLLVPEGRGPGRGFRVFPGQLLLKTITYLAARGRSYDGAGGKLVLEDVENHLQQYGVDFSSAAEARPLLMQELQAMGLLAGSPDAGSSVAVSCPY